jgi:hypothetical protein
MAIAIRSNIGIPGTDIYYLTTKEKPTVTTLTARQTDIVQYLTCARLLEGKTPRRLAGPTNQGDRTVRSGEYLQDGGYFRNLARPLIQGEKSDLRSKNPHKRNWLPR